MPNWCKNILFIEGPYDSLAKIRDLVRGKETAFDFEKIVPMPDYIFRGDVGPKEKEIYGKNNWYDWSWKNWGTKWNSEAARYALTNDCLGYVFYTAWSSCEPVIEELARMFPDMKLDYKFGEPGFCFCGEREYENGKTVYSWDGDYEEGWDLG